MWILIKGKEIHMGRLDNLDNNDTVSDSAVKDTSVQESKSSAGGKPRLTGNYAWWFTADTASALSQSIRSFAISVVLLTLTGSTVQAGYMSALSYLLVGLTALMGGVIVDRYDRRKLLILSTLIGAVVYGITFIWGSLWGLNVVLLYAITVILGIKAGLLGNVSDILLREVVPPEELPVAMSLNQGRDATVSLLGSPLSGFLVTVSSVFPFAVATVLNLVGAFSAKFIKLRKQVEKHDDPGNSSHTTNSMKDQFRKAFKGFSLIHRTPILRRMVMVSVLFFPFINAVLNLLVYYTVNTEKSPLSAGWLESSTALGLLVGSLISARLVKKVDTGKIIILAFLVPVPLVFGAVFAPNYIVRLCFLLPIVLMLPAANASSGGFIMQIIPQNLLGRYFAVMSLLGVIFNPLMSLVVGYGLKYWGLRVTGTIFATGMLITALPSFSSLLRNIPTPDKWNDYAQTLTVKS